VIDRPVVVLGPLRSGCSLVAGVCHRLGYSAGMVAFMPQPPSWRMDWQDHELTTLLVLRRWPDVAWWHDYLERRIHFSRAIGFEGRIVLNCQWLALCWESFREALGPVEPFVIKAYRQEETMAVSMAAHPGLRQEDQTEIRAALLRIPSNCQIGYEYATGDPGHFVRALAGHLGQEDDATVQAAIGLVGKPTIYAPQTPELAADRP